MNRRQLLMTVPAALLPAPRGPYRVSGLTGSREAGTERWATEIVPRFDGPFRILASPQHFERWEGGRWVATD